MNLRLQRSAAPNTMRFDTLKPIVGTILLALYLPVPFYLLWLHGPHKLWRSIGRLAFVFLLTPYSFMVYFVIRAHSLWSWHAWPWPNWTVPLAAPPLVAAGFLAWHTYRTIEPATLHLLRQIVPDTDRVLITDGILGRIRHPRYLMFALIAAGNVLITGYPLVLAAFVVTTALLAFVVRLEEKELFAYFGTAFLEYKRRVPALIPRVSWRNRPRS